MNFKEVTLFMYMNIITLNAYNTNPNIKQLIEFIKRRLPLDDVSLEEPGVLPRAVRIIPGITLIQPKRNSLKSAVKFPNPDIGNLVYGNLDNLGITYDKTNERLLYSGFRRTTQRLLESTIFQAIRNIHKSNGDDNSDVIVIEIDPQERKSDTALPPRKTNNEEENNASEILDDLSSSSREAAEDDVNYRRVHRRHKYRDRTKHYQKSDSTDSDSDSESSKDSLSDTDYEKNRGNPFTVYKEKYLQNFPWKHDMDGDHMNINPMAPGLNMPGPSGPDLFFGRKWWYFNQDDYRPLR